MLTRSHDPFSPHVHLGRPLWAAAASAGVQQDDATVPNDPPSVPESAENGPAGPGAQPDPFEDDDARLRAALAALDAAQGAR